MTAHWGVPDPAAVDGSADEVQRAYSAAFSALDRRISLFLSLPLETLDAFALQKAVQNIGNQ
jgi:arsenate reductase